MNSNPRKSPGRKEGRAAANKLTLVRKSDPGVPEHLRQKAVEAFMEMERAGFARNLDSVRGMWRKYRARPQDSAYEVGFD
jgi:hypothetical protein